MKQTLRTQLILKHLYNESSSTKKAFTEQLLASDWSFQEEYNGLKKAVDSLKKLNMSPRHSVLNNILAYSQATRLEASC